MDANEEKNISHQARFGKRLQTFIVMLIFIIMPLGGISLAAVATTQAIYLYESSYDNAQNISTRLLGFDSKRDCRRSTTDIKCTNRYIVNYEYTDEVTGKTQDSRAVSYKLWKKLKTGKKKGKENILIEYNTPVIYPEHTLPFVSFLGMDVGEKTLRLKGEDETETVYLTAAISFFTGLMALWAFLYSFRCLIDRDYFIRKMQEDT